MYDLSGITGGLVGAAAVAVLPAVAAPGCKLCCGEGDAAEHLAGILGAAAQGVAAVLGGDGFQKI